MEAACVCVCVCGEEGAEEGGGGAGGCGGCLHLFLCVEEGEQSLFFQTQRWDLWWVCRCVDKSDVVVMYGGEGLEVSLSLSLCLRGEKKERKYRGHKGIP